MTGFKHGHNPRNGVRSDTYKSWMAMRIRCSHKDSYKGVTIDQSWDSFERFLLDMGERPDGMTLDRIDGNKGYSADNCRWSTPLVQSRNKKKQHGVRWSKQRRMWRADIGHLGDVIYLGCYTDWWDAMCARKSAENKYWRAA